MFDNKNNSSLDETVGGGEVAELIEVAAAGSAHRPHELPHGTAVTIHARLDPEA